MYLSGPMSGIKEHNFPAFHQAANRLRWMGYTVINPAELDESDSMAPGERPWAWYITRDLRELLDCDTVAVLPGWRKSKGAKLEVYVARMLGMKVVSAVTMKKVLTMREFFKEGVAFIGVPLLLAFVTISDIIKSAFSGPECGGDDS